MRVRAREAGFFLADMLVTLTISAFVLVGLTGLSATLLRTADRSVAQMEVTEDLDRTLSTLAELIRSATRTRFTGPEPQPFVFNGNDQRLMFVRTKEQPGRPRALEVVAFRTQADGTLLRAEAPLPPEAGNVSDLPFGMARKTYQGTARLRFSYRKTTKPVRPDEWLPSWPIGMRMPQAVSIEAVDASGRQVFARVEVPIMADIDIGCLTAGFCDDSSSSLDGPSRSTAAPTGATP